MASDATVSVVIPCYNHGHFLNEAIPSVEHAGATKYEIIVVNDGSTDSGTLEIIKNLEARGYNVINQANQGLSASRNNGIRAASGRYILTLDADNKVKPTYMEQARAVLDKNDEVGVVYSDFIYFGDKSYTKRLRDFSFPHLLASNYIDACAVFRKSVWEQCGGFDVNLKTGHEDWEFWISVAERGWKFHHLKEPLFYYRVRGNAMTSQMMRPETFHESTHYIFAKHLDTLRSEYIKYVQWETESAMMRRSPIAVLGRLFLQAYLPSIRDWYRQHFVR
ncbi:MAG: glycosyltransferase family 2 protein [Candidatus Marsarchaeota archaeon]|nr:glycosyltransferase family 2 protein [Candidatus Marsarchaeota archaeon]